MATKIAYSLALVVKMLHTKYQPHRPHSLGGDSWTEIHTYIQIFI